MCPFTGGGRDIRAAPSRTPGQVCPTLSQSISEISQVNVGPAVSRRDLGQATSPPGHLCRSSVRGQSLASRGRVT
jgi:hypothetical protein